MELLEFSFAEVLSFARAESNAGRSQIGAANMVSPTPADWDSGTPRSNERCVVPSFVLMTIANVSRVTLHEMARWNTDC